MTEEDGNNTMVCMEHEEFVTSQFKLKMLASIAAQFDVDIDKFLKTCDNAMTLGPLFDPSRCSGSWFDSADQWVELARAAKDFKEVATKVLKKAGELPEEE